MARGPWIRPATAQRCPGDHANDLPRGMSAGSPSDQALWRHFSASTCFELCSNVDPSLRPRAHPLHTRVVWIGPPGLRNTGAKRNLPVRRPGRLARTHIAPRRNALEANPHWLSFGTARRREPVPATLSKALLRPCLAYPLASLDVSEQRPVYRAGASPNEGLSCCGRYRARTYDLTDVNRAL